MGDPRFARASYALFAVAALAAILKLGGITGAKPAVLHMAPADPAAAVADPPRSTSKTASRTDPCRTGPRRTTS